MPNTVLAPCSSPQCHFLASMRKNPTRGRRKPANSCASRRGRPPLLRRHRPPCVLERPAVKRRIDRLRADGSIRGFSAVIDPEAFGWRTEALVELFYAPGTQLSAVAASLARHPQVIEAWSVTGDADAIARVRTTDNADLERLIMDLQQDGQVIRTRSQVIMSDLIARPGG